MLIVEGAVTGSATEPYVTTTIGSKTRAWLLTYPESANVQNSGDGNWGAPNARHSEMANVGFADGHVKAMKTRTFYYYNASPGTPWLNPAAGG